MQSVPILAVRRFTPAQMEPDRRTEVAPVFHIQNVGQAAAIVNRVRVELGGFYGETTFLDSQDYGRGQLNLGMGHDSALAPGGEMPVSVTLSGKGKWDPFSCGCIVEFEDVVGNRFLAKHDLGRTYTLSVKVGDSWQNLEQGFSVDPTTGRLMLP
jgi:hypothetical protein